MLLRAYIYRQLIHTIFLVGGILLVIFCGVEFSAIMRSSASGSIPQGLLGKAMLLHIPFLLSLMLPLVVLLAGILVIYRLHDNGELTVVQAVGVDTIKINKWVMSVTAAMAILVAISSLYLEPKANKVQHVLFSSINKDLAISNFQPGQFYSLMQGDVVVFVGESQHGGAAFSDIFIAKKNKESKQPDQHAWDIVTAEKALKNTKADVAHSWSLHNVWNFNFVPGSAAGHIIHAKDFFVTFPGMNKLGVQQSSLEEMSLQKLLKNNDSPMAKSLLQWRLSLPLSVLLLGLFIVPFSYERTLGKQYMRIFAAITLYALYLAIVLVCRYYVSKQSISWQLGVMIPPLFFMSLLVLYYIKRIYQNIRGWLWN